VMNCSLVGDDVINSETSVKGNQILQSPKGSLEHESDVVLLVDLGLDCDVLLGDLSFDDSFDFLKTEIFQSDCCLNFKLN
jgi:hypothetical protein